MIYDHWEKTTSRLCEVGEKANKFIEEKYFSEDYEDLFQNASSSTLKFKHLVSYRHDYWLTQPNLNNRATLWLDDLEYCVNRLQESNNKLGMLKEFVWSKYSILPLLLAASKTKKHHFLKEIDRIIPLIQTIELFLKNYKNAALDFLLIERNRLSLDWVKKNNKQQFTNIFQFKLPQWEQFLFCELIETWNFAQNTINICLPLSIGCVANCKMCEFSLFKPINIPSSLLRQLIDFQVRNNKDIPFASKPNYSFYYLGGGDALQYKELPTLLSQIAQSFSAPKQIISTIALGSIQSFTSFLAETSRIPNLGLQWSLNSFNENNRKAITGCSSLIPIKQCIPLFKEYAQTTNRKVSVSIMFFEEDEYQNSIKNNIATLLDPTIFTLNFAHIQPNSLIFTHENSLSTPIDTLYQWAIENNYDVSIDSPLNKDNEDAPCGRVSSTVYNGNSAYIKDKNND